MAIAMQPAKQVEEKRRTNMKQRRVVVTGMGVVTPLGHEPDVFYNNLLEGVSGISEIENFDYASYPTRIAGEIKSFSTDGWVEPKLSKRMDEFMLYMLTAGKKALADAGITDEVLGELDKIRCGILIGSAMGGITSALDYEDFNAAMLRLIKRGKKFGEISLRARLTIAMLSQDFIFDGCTILVHGFLRVVLEVLKTAASNRKLFRVLCTEGRPDRTGLRFSNELAQLGVPVKLLIDSAVGYTMDEVDMVFVGADGESGGIISVMGTFQIALVAHSMTNLFMLLQKVISVEEQKEGMTCIQPYSNILPYSRHHWVTHQTCSIC